MLRVPHLTYPLGKPLCQPPKCKKAYSPSQVRLEHRGLVYWTGVLVCLGPRSKHLAVVSSTLGPKVGHELDLDFVEDG